MIRGPPADETPGKCHEVHHRGGGLIDGWVVLWVLSVVTVSIDGLD